MNNFYVDFKNHKGKLVNKAGNVVTVDMNNDEHVKALNIRQAFINNGIVNINVTSKVKSILKFRCACGTDISISAQNEIEFEFGDHNVDMDPLKFKLDEYGKKCYHCGTEFQIEITDDNELILKPIN